MKHKNFLVPFFQLVSITKRYAVFYNNKVFYIDLTESQTSGCMFEIYDSRGRVVRKKTIRQKIFEIIIPEVKGGMYES